MQRTAIARALVTKPALLLADEPTGNLDSATGAVILDVLAEAVADDGVALVMVTHDVGAASRASRTLHVRDGRLVRAGARGRAAAEEADHRQEEGPAPAGGGQEAGRLRRCAPSACSRSGDSATSPSAPSSPSSPSPLASRSASPSSSPRRASSSRSRDFGRSLAGPADLRIVGATPRAGLDLTIVDGLADVDGVAAVVPMIQVAAQLDFLPADANGAERRIESEPVLVLGVDCRVQTLLGMAGCDPTVLQAAGDGALVIGPGLAPPAGTVASMRTDAGRIALAGAPVQADLAAINDGRVVVLSLEAAQRQFRQEGFADIAYVLPDDGADIDAVRSRLEDAVGEQNAVLGIDDPPPETEIVLRAFIPLFSLLGLFGLGTGAVLVRNTVALSLEERRRQMAITAAIGGDGRTLVGGAIAEAAVLGFLGGLLGVAGGIAVAGPIVSGISEFTENIAGVKLDMHTPASVGVIGALLGIFVGAGAAIGPARRAARLDVAAELSGRSVVAESKPVRVVRRLALWSGVAALATLVCWLSQRDGGIERWQATVGPPAFLVVTVSLLLAGAALTPLLIGRLARALAGTRRSTWLLSMAELVRDPRRVGIMSVAIASPIVTGFATDGFVSSARESITTSFEDEDSVASRCPPSMSTRATTPSSRPRRWRGCVPCRRWPTSNGVGSSRPASGSAISSACRPSTDSSSIRTTTSEERSTRPASPRVRPSSAPLSPGAPAPAPATRSTCRRRGAWSISPCRPSSRAATPGATRSSCTRPGSRRSTATGRPPSWCCDRPTASPRTSSPPPCAPRIRRSTPCSGCRPPTSSSTTSWSRSTARCCPSG